MSKKPMTVAEMASIGGRARARKYSKAKLREFAKRAGRPAKLDRKGLARLKTLLGVGKTHAECAAELGVSIRTIGRAVARMRAGV
jgi:hypothetical protein